MTTPQSFRVPLTLFTNVISIIPYANWSDPSNPSDPWTGYPYQWQVTVNVQSQTHSDPETPIPYTYNGLSVTIGSWLVFTTSSVAVEIISISSQNDQTLVFIVEDVGLSNIVNNPTQSGIGIGSVSDPGVYDCLIINLNNEGIPVFATIPDYAVPINLIPDIVNRFQSYNYIQDFIPGNQPGNSFQIGDVIYLNENGSYTASLSTLVRSTQSIGTVTSINQPDVGNFTYRPINRYVTNLPTLPGFPGDLLYISSTTPGGVTNVVTTGATIPVYIKITNTSAIFTSGSSSGGVILPTGEIAFGSPSGQLTGNSLLTFNALTNTLTVGTYASNVITAPANGLIVSGNVGIRTSDPTQALQVVGNIQINNAAAALSGIYFPDGTYQSTSAASYSTPPGGPVYSVQYNSGLGFGGSNNFVFTTNSVGIGTPAPVNRLDVNGSVAIGTYAGAHAAPTNGVAIAGNVGIGTFSTMAKLGIVAGTNQVGINIQSAGTAGNLLQFTNSAGSSTFTIDGIGNVTVGGWQGNAITADHGGTGQFSYATGDVLYAASTGAISALSRLPIGSNGNVLVVSCGLPAWGNVSINDFAGVLPYRSGGTNSSVSFTQGSIIFAGPTGFGQCNSNFYWDDSNRHLGINTSSPATALDVNGIATIRSGGNIVSGGLYVAGGTGNFVGGVIANSLTSNTFVNGSGIYSAGAISAAGSITGTGFTANATVSILGTTTSVGYTTGALTVAGGVGVAGNLNVQGASQFLGCLSVVGNLIVGGNIVAVNTELLNVENPTIGLGTGIEGNALVANDGYDRGLVINYYDTAQNTNDYAFLGRQNATGDLIYITNVQPGSKNISNVVNPFTTNSPGFQWGSAYLGNLTLLGNVISSSPITGTLILAGVGGLGIGGSTNIADTLDVGSYSYAASGFNTSGPLVASTVTSNGFVFGSSLNATGVIVGNIITANSLISTADITASGNVVTNNLVANNAVTAANLFSNGNIWVTKGGWIGNLSILNSTNSTSFQTGALTVNGGVGVNGNLYVNGNIVGSNVAVVTGNSGVFYGDGYGFGAIYGGISTGYTFQQNTILQLSANTNNYAQLNLQNIDDQPVSSGDLVVTADNGNATVNYIDLGINSSTYSVPGQGLQLANDGYLYVQGNAAAGFGGNLNISTGTPADIIFSTNGYDYANEVARIKNGQGITISLDTTTNSSTTGALVVAGGVGIGGNLFVACSTWSGTIYSSGNVSAVGTVSADTISSNSSVTGNSFVLNGNLATVSNTSTIVVDTFPTTAFRTVHYLAQITDDTNIGQYHSEQLFILHDGTTAYQTEFNLVYSVQPLGMFSSSITDGIFSLFFTAYVSTSKSIRVVRTGVVP